VCFNLLNLISHFVRLGAVSSIFISVLFQSPLPAEDNRMNDPVHISVEYTHEGELHRSKKAVRTDGNREKYTYILYVNFANLLKDLRF